MAQVGGCLVCSGQFGFLNKKKEIIMSLMGHVEGLVSAGDKIVSAIQTGSSGGDASVAAGQAITSVLEILSESGVVKGLNIGSALYGLKNQADQLYNANSTLDALRKMADALATVGSIMLAIPTPQTRVIGITGRSPGLTT